MDKVLLKRTAIQSVALMLAVITLSYAYRQYQSITISANNMEVSEEFLGSDEELSTSEGNLSSSNDIQSKQQDIADNIMDINLDTVHPELMKLMRSVDTTVLEQMGERYLVIKKPQGNNITLQLDDLYMNKSIKISLTGLSGEDMKSQMVGRVLNQDAFIGNPTYTEIVTPDNDATDEIEEPILTKDYGNDFVHGITITNHYDEISKYYASELLIELDGVYAPILYEDKNYYYIDLKNPREVYDNILVIDAGHGGKDSGALSEGDQYYEKNINLDILLQLKELLDKEQIKVYYTRTADDKVFLRPRVELANAVDCDFFISIHCNANEATWPNGTEILYYDTEFKGVKAKGLADIFLQEIGKTTSLKKREIVKKQKDEIYILKKAVVPAILIEVGYLTNHNDMNYLSKEENRKSVAQGIFDAIMKAYETYIITDDGQ